jgi:DNA-binding GntR family transcriptional regulator
MITPVKEINLRNQLTAHLFDAILRGDLKPGERIVEGSLARRLEVAQTTLREALQELEYRYLLTKSGRLGTFVNDLSVKDVEDIYMVRLALEPVAGSLASLRMHEDHFRELQDILNRMRQAGKTRDLVDLVKLDLKFHQLIWSFSDNRSIERALNAVCQPLFVSYMMRISSAEVYDIEKDLEKHSVLIEALRSRMAPQVEESFRQVMEAFRNVDVRNQEIWLRDRTQPPGKENARQRRRRAVTTP